MKKSILGVKKLRVYKFDWDDNILKLPTKIKIYKDNQPLYVSTSELLNKKKVKLSAWLE